MYFNGFFGLVIEMVLVLVVLNLRARVIDLERKANPQRGRTLPDTPDSKPDFSPAPATVAVTEPATPSAFRAWLAEDWLLKLGASLLIIGFGWVVRYAFLNNLIGPVGRISLGIAAGIAFLVFGFWRMKSYVNQGGVFLVLGSTVVILTVFAARYVYDFFTPLTALGIMFLSSAVVGLASVKYKSSPLAVISIVLAGIVPLLTHSPVNDVVGLFTYLIAVVLGTLWITALTGKRDLLAVALAVVACYSAPVWTGAWASERPILMLFAYAFTAIFFMANAAGIMHAKDEKSVSSDATIAGLNGVFLLLWVMTGVGAEWQSLVFAAWAVVFAVGGYALFVATQKRAAFYSFAGVGAMLVAAATSAEAQGATLTIAYAVEAGLLSCISYLILRDIRVAEKISMLLVVPMALSANSISSYAWRSGIPYTDFFVLLVLGAVLSALGLFLQAKGEDEPHKDGARLYHVALILGSLYFYALLWLSLHAGDAYQDIATMACLVIYALIGVIAYVAGRAKGTSLRIYGEWLLIAVALRLFVVDVWTMELTGRIATFFVVGALMMSTVFLGKKK